MSDQNLGHFSEGFALFRKLMAATPDQTACLKIFMNAATEVAKYCNKGLDRTIAADELTDMAVTYGLNDPNAVQFVIARAFEKIEEPDHVPDDVGELEERTNGHAKKEPPAPQLLPLINIRAWQGIEPKPRAWIVRERIPDRNVTLLTGHGGVGKTLLTQQLSVGTVLGRDWIGEICEPGPVLFISAEDDEDEMHFRYNKIANCYGVTFDELADAGLNVLSLAGKDSAMAVADNRGIVKPTELFHTMVRTAREIRPRWIGLDTAADIFIVNERDRSQVRQCISLLRGVCLELGTAIILLAHPSLSGISSGSGLSGSTAWNNSVRSRLYLKSEKKKKTKDDEEDERDEDDNGTGVRILEFMKSNYSALAKPVRLAWRDGLFALEQSVASLPQMQRVALEQQAERVFLEILGRYNRQGMTVSHKERATSYGPSIFAREPEARELHRNIHQRIKLLKGAMLNLLAKDRLTLGSGPKHLPPSRQRECIYAGGTLL